MANQLGGCTVAINSRRVQVNYFPSLSLGLTSGGIFVPMLVDSTGALVISSSGGGSDVTIVGPGSTTTPAKTTVNTNGTVAAGKTHVEFIASIDYVGTILGDATTGVPSANIPVSVLTLDAPPWAPLAAIPYTFSAGSLTIITSVTA